MARIRTIKPEQNKDEELAACTIWARHLFTFLPTLADRKGRLEDRPKFIKVEIFPWDDVDCEKLLVELSPKFITRYEAEGRKYIQINTFEKHQIPHPREAESTIPSPPRQSLGYAKAQPRPGQGPAKDMPSNVDKGKGMDKGNGREWKGMDKTTANCPPSAVDSPANGEEQMPEELKNVPLLDMRFPYGAMKGIHVANIPADQAAFILKNDKRLGKRLRKALELRVKIKADECKR